MGNEVGFVAVWIKIKGIQVDSKSTNKVCIPAGGGVDLKPKVYGSTQRMWHSAAELAKQQEGNKKRMMPVQRRYLRMASGLEKVEARGGGSKKPKSVSQMCAEEPACGCKLPKA